MNEYIITKGGLTYTVWACTEASALGWYGWKRAEVDGIRKAENDGSDYALYH